MVNQKNSLEKQKNDLLREAKQKARLLLQETKEETDSILAEIRKLQEEKETTEINKKAEAIKASLCKKLKKVQQSVQEPLIASVATDKNHKYKPGDCVYVPSLKQEGSVLTAPDLGKNMLVQLGIMKMTLKTSQVLPLKKEKVSFDKASIGKSISTRSASVSPELHVRMQALDEALENTDRYLDNAFLAGLKLITIVHGKGEGILRRGIHQFLKNHPHVKTFRLGRYGEGDSGVTIVELM